MRVGLVDVDNYKSLNKCYPNLALMKISAYHKRKGDEVFWYEPMFSGHCDVVYMSKVFSFTEDYPYFVDADEIHRGGSGYAISLKDGKEVFDKSKNNALPDEIEHIMPDYSLYGVKDTAYGFLTRGCPRGCDFCIVKDKEGLCSTKVADLTEFWSGQSNIILCDPNILACKDWKDLLNQLAESGATVDFNQGLDIRLMTTEKAEALKKIKIRQVHFAFDRYQDKEIIERKITEWTEVFGERFNRSKVSCYVLCGFDTTMQQNIDRILFLRSKGISPYVMLYNKQNIKRGDVLRKLQRWCNNKIIFWSCDTFEKYLKGDRNE